eukprot:CAMPEP_0203746978 /NCGR_PEP_ID=MMETSP0098-20131031/2242_1 /ASSEMBLY_ACC=CAM_ASM_000208 /TAXON_ID=96639 /ORGANISM=" , Strain NY0313808BC1" /LENGTH=1167 /DNA_ID=CAMNT_0050635237 /DNA_START=364 /DNA_END=3864 /DNA_ORIENTATION=-
MEHPDKARVQVLERCDVMEDTCTILLAWAELEGKYGTALDKIIVCANGLNALRGASGTVSAIAAVVGSFQSLGKHHLGLQQSILSQANNILGPLARDQRKQIGELTNTQTSVQEEANVLAEKLAATKKKFETSKKAEDSIALQQYSVKYAEVCRAQNNGLRHFLSNLYGVWFHRVQVLNSCLGNIMEANAHVMQFNEEVVTALQTIVSGVDVGIELRFDVETLVELEKSTGSDVQGGALASLVYELLGDVEPDIASSSVDAAATLCTNTITVAEVAERITNELASSLATRAKDMDSLASSLHLGHLNVSCEYSDVYSEEQSKETERQAWRMFMVTMKQSSMVLADLGEKLDKVGVKFASLKDVTKAAKKQVQAARGAAHKELQLVAHSLKESRAKLEQCSAEISKSEDAVSKASLEVQDVKSKFEEPSTEDGNTDGAAAEGTNDGGGAEEQDAKPVESSSSNKSPPDVVRRLFGLSVKSTNQQLTSAEDKLAKAELKLAKLKQNRESLRTDFQTYSERVEAQIKAYAVQIAGTISGFVSTHAARLNEMKSLLESLVAEVANSNATIQQLQNKMARELSKIDPVIDIQLFVDSCDKQKVQDSAGVIIQKVCTVQETDHIVAENDEESDEEGVNAVHEKPEKTVTGDAKTEAADLLNFKLPPGEVIVDSFSCAYLPGKVPQQGRVFVTERFLCFNTLAIYEPMFGSCKVVVRLCDVASVTKAASAWGLVANSLVVKLHPPTNVSPFSSKRGVKELFFTSLFYRNKCYDMISRLAQAQEGKGEASPKEPWVQLDPRLPDSYTGNNLVITLEDGGSNAGSIKETPPKTTKKKKNSGFLRLGLSTSDLEKLSEELNDKDRKVAEAEKKIGEAATPEDGSSDETRDIGPCKNCSKPQDPYQPCNCWTGKKMDLRSGHTLLASTYWKGSLEENVKMLWLGGSPELGCNGLDLDFDQALGNKMGDIDQLFPQFSQTPLCKLDYSPRDGYPKLPDISEGDDSTDDAVFSRVVSFGHPISNAYFGKQVAHSSQVQAVRGCTLKDGDIVARGDIVCKNADTALSGFPYSDSFVVRTRCVLVKLKHPNPHVGEAWCRLDVSCKIFWLKSVSVPFLRGKIEKENIQTGKNNQQHWKELVLSKLGDKIASATSNAPVKEAPMLVKQQSSQRGQEFSLDELW